MSSGLADSITLALQLENSSITTYNTHQPVQQPIQPVQQSTHVHELIVLVPNKYITSNNNNNNTEHFEQIPIYKFNIPIGLIKPVRSEIRSEVIIDVSPAKNVQQMNANFRKVKPLDLKKTTINNPATIITSYTQILDMVRPVDYTTKKENEDDNEIDYNKDNNIVYMYEVPVDKNWTIIEYVVNRPPVGWRNLFINAYPELVNIKNMLDNYQDSQGPYVPTKDLAFNVFYKCPLNKVKVVIIGQDPYPQILADGTYRAQGYSFGVKKGDQIPSSLNNIYKELRNCYPDYQKPTHGDLSEWMQQGVFMLNACLTTQPGHPGAHKKLWVPFVEKVLKAISHTNENVIFLLWGRDAVAAVKNLSEKVKRVETTHPSGLSANRGFIGSRCFIEVNQILQETGQIPIDWKITG